MVHMIKNTAINSLICNNEINKHNIVIDLFNVTKYIV